MNILAIDTASEYLSLAIAKNEYVTTNLNLVNNQQSTYIINKIQELLTEQNLSIKDIDLIAYNQGPGSFTGLRVGLSVALGIALGLNIQLMPIPAFAVLAHASNLNENLLVGIDARLDQLYLAGLNRQNLNSYLIEPSLVNFTDIPNLVNYTLCGYGLNKCWPKFSEHTKKMPFIDLEYPDASNIITLAKTNQYQALPANNAKLFYLRNKIALNLEEQQNAAKSKC